eukprot:4950477-Alexandrium_andersonii.AAC.1
MKSTQKLQSSAIRYVVQQIGFTARNNGATLKSQHVLSHRPVVAFVWVRNSSPPSYSHNGS